MCLKVNNALSVYTVKDFGVNFIYLVVHLRSKVQRLDAYYLRFFVFLATTTDSQETIFP